MAKKSIYDLLVDLRIVQVTRASTDAGDIVVVAFESMTSPMLSAVLDIPAEVADEYDFPIG